MRRTFDFPADTAVLGKVGEVVGDKCREAGFDENEIGDVQLSIDEACTNTIIHGLNKDPEKLFQLVIEWSMGLIEITIVERGKPFNPGEVKKPDLDASLEERDIGGLGLFFVHQLMDEVDFSTSEDGVKTLRMLKRKK